MKNFDDFTRKKVGNTELYLPSDFVMRSTQENSKYKIPFGIDINSVEDIEVYPHKLLKGFSKPVYAKKVSGADPTKPRTEKECWFDRYYISYGIGERTGEIAIYIPFKPLQNVQIRRYTKYSYFEETLTKTINYVASLLNSDIIYNRKGIWINQQLPIADPDMPLGFRTTKTEEKANPVFKPIISNSDLSRLVEKYDPTNNSRIINTNYAVLMVLAVIFGKEYQVFTEEIYGPAKYADEGTFLESFISDVCHDSFSLCTGLKATLSGKCSFQLKDIETTTYFLSVLYGSLFPLDKNIPILTYDDVEDRFFYNNYHQGIYSCPYLKPLQSTVQRRSTIICYDI